MNDTSDLSQNQGVGEPDSEVSELLLRLRNALAEEYDVERELGEGGMALRRQHDELQFPASTLDRIRGEGQMGHHIRSHHVLVDCRQFLLGPRNPRLLSNDGDGTVRGPLVLRGDPRLYDPAGPLSPWGPHCVVT